MIKVLKAKDIIEIVNRVGRFKMLSQAITQIELALVDFHEENDQHIARSGFLQSKPNPTLLEWMPYKSGSQVTVKIVGYNPLNPSLNDRSSVTSMSYHYDFASGQLLGIAESTLLTAIRTGAASAISSKLLASDDSKTLGLVGCGAQAVLQMQAISMTFPITKVLVFDVDKAQEKSLCERAAFLDLDIQPSSLEDLERESDIICTATSNEPNAKAVIAGEKVKPHVHINAVGSDTPGKIELPYELLNKAMVIPDLLEQAKVEGDCQQLSPSQIGRELHQIVKAPSSVQAAKNQISVFDSTGLPLEDQVMMKMALKYADLFDIGTSVEIDRLVEDPYNPYV